MTDSVWGSGSPRISIHQNIVSEDNHFNRLGHKMENEEASILLLFGLKNSEREKHTYTYTDQTIESWSIIEPFDKKKIIIATKIALTVMEQHLHVLLIETLKT
jgi:hypothetical protein